MSIGSFLQHHFPKRVRKTGLILVILFCLVPWGSLFLPGPILYIVYTFERLFGISFAAVPLVLFIWLSSCMPGGGDFLFLRGPEVSVSACMRGLVYSAALIAAGVIVAMLAAKVFWAVVNWWKRT